jgi:hypothetical protein
LAFTANDYIDAAAEEYGDTDFVRPTVVQWIKHFNSAVRALVLVRPDAGSTTEVIQLAAGVKQDLPTDALRLLDITRNMGVDGETVGKIIRPADRDHLDYSNLLWYAQAGDSAVDNFHYDQVAPNHFYVTPPISQTVAVYVEIITSKLPTAATATTSASGINDIFFEPMVQFMLHKAFSTDDEEVEFNKSIVHLQNFFNLLQVEMTAYKAMGPEGKE